MGCLLFHPKELTMPLFDYQCEECKGIVEVIQSYDAEAPVCCGSPMSRLPTLPAKIDVKIKGGIKTHSKGYKEGYAKEYRRRLQEARQK